MISEMPPLLRPPTVYIDESGNSGQNLLDPAQPVFVLSSVHLEPETAQRLSDGLAGNADEAHYTQMRKRGAGQRRILQLVGDPALHNAVRISAVNKEFMAVAKLIDLLLEPWYSDRGLDFYANGNAQAIAGDLASTGPKCCPDSFSTLVAAFVEFVWKPSTETAVALSLTVSAARTEAASHPIGRYLSRMERDPLALLATYGKRPDIVPDALDPALATTVEQAIWWGERLGPFLLVYDASKVVDRWTEHLLKLSDPDEAERLSVSEAEPLPPIQLAGLQPAVSHDSPAIQVADILAGAVAEVLRVHARGNAMNEWQERLCAAGLLRWVSTNSIWPEDPWLSSEIAKSRVRPER